MNAKICKKCGIEKPIEQYSVNRGARDGRVNSCKPCEVARVKKWTQDNPEKVKAWTENNKYNKLIELTVRST